VYFTFLFLRGGGGDFGDSSTTKSMASVAVRGGNMMVSVVDDSLSLSLIPRTDHGQSTRSLLPGGI